MIYHITTHELWNKALDKGYYRHPSLDSEGFIHCSTAQQISGTLAKHFADAEEVVVLHIVDRRIKELIKVEQLGNASEPFPHIYGQLELFAIENLEILVKNEKGEWE